MNYSCDSLSRFSPYGHMIAGDIDLETYSGIFKVSASFNTPPQFTLQD